MVRACAELGLPSSIAAPAVHIAMSRVWDTRSHSIAFGRDNKFTDGHEVLQKAPVLAPIALVCRHALKCTEASDGEVCCGVSRNAVQYMRTLRAMSIACSAILRVLCGPPCMCQSL